MIEFKADAVDDPTEKYPERVRIEGYFKIKGQLNHIATEAEFFVENLYTSLAERDIENAALVFLALGAQIADLIRKSTGSIITEAVADAETDAETEKVVDSNVVV